MTIGIYELSWKDSDKVYIGQSVNIEKRFINHKSRLKRGNHPDYLQNMYNKYGEPILSIIEKCDIKDLDEREIYWISVTNNINISSGGSAGLYGYNSPNCKYKKEQIIMVAELLTNPDNTNIFISEITGVSSGTIDGIKTGKRHTWLSEELPEIWSKLRNTFRFSISQQKRFKTNCILMDRNGVTYIVKNLSKFATDHGLNTGHLCSLVRGELQSHKGFVLIENLKGGSDE